MPYVSLNPATGEVLQQFPGFDRARLADTLQQVAAAQPDWAALSFAERGAYLRRIAHCLLLNRERYAGLITLEMGKLRREAIAEVEKSALVCNFYADEAERQLAPQVMPSDASHSYVLYQPLGVLLGVMPWNYPFWQVFRYVAPALMAGNACVLKHASNVPQCALEIERICRDAGLPDNIFRTLLIDSAQVAEAIASPHVQAVTLTGSEAAGRRVAGAAGMAMKKSVLELGGSDPFIVLADADLDWAVAQAVPARFTNAGQSCISAKRFIVVPEIADLFVARLQTEIARLQCGDPLDDTTTLAPLARADLRDELHQQVQDSIRAGAVPLLGCEPLDGAGAFYAPSLLDRVQPGMRAYDEEIFGPVALVLRARDEADAIRIANDTRFGLGSSIWSRDLQRAQAVAARIEAGNAYINSLVKSDPRLPFGGIKASGYGRELSGHGIHEFVNAKTVWIK